MLAWFTANLINIVIVAVLLLAVALAVRSMALDRREGKSSCGGNCAHCGACACGDGEPGKQIKGEGRKPVPHSVKT